MDKIRILNIDIHSISLCDLLPRLTKGIVFTPNVDHLVKLQVDRKFYESYQEANWIICDSKIVNLASRLLGTSFKEVIPGSSLLPAYYSYQSKNKSTKIFLLGAAEGVAESAKKKINYKVGWNIIVATHSPSFGFETKLNECNMIIDIINKSGANVLVIGVGAPKQEKWIHQYRHSLKNIDLIMALGATIDFEAGNILRAPIFFQQLSIEWLYRLFQEPRRLWKRYLIDDLPFFLYILKQKLGMYKNPFSR